MPIEPTSAEHARIFVFLACIVAAGVGGYVLRRLGWAKGEWAPRLMSAAIIGCDAPIALLAVWYLTIRADVWKVPVAGAIVAVATIAIVAPRMPPIRVGIASGISTLRRISNLMRCVRSKRRAIL